MAKDFVYFTAYTLNGVEHEISVRYGMEWPEPEVNFHGGPVDPDFRFMDGAPAPEQMITAMQADRAWMNALQNYLAEHANEVAAEAAQEGWDNG